MKRLLFPSLLFSSLLIFTLSNFGCQAVNGPAQLERAPAPMAFAEFLSSTDGQIAATSDCKTEQCVNHRREFRWVTYVGEQVYCYWDEKKVATGTDFNKLAAELEAKITDNLKLEGYFDILRTWAAAFHDGHVNALMGDARGDIAFYTSPVRVELINPDSANEKLVVVNAEDKTGLAAGDEVLLINDQTAKQVLSEASARQSGSTERMRRFWAARSLPDAIGADEAKLRPLVLTVLHQKKPLRVELDRLVEIWNPQATNSPESSGAEYVSAKILAGNIGYLRINAFGGSSMSKILNATMDRLSETQGLIIDLRTNGGGDLSGNTILARLSDKPLTRFQQSPRMSGMLLIQRPELYFFAWTHGQTFSDWRPITVQPEKVDRLYRQPVVALTSAYCFSACDTFVSALKTNKLATIIGSATGGGTGQPLAFDLPITHFRFRYSVVRGLTISGGPIEGVGTTPDVPVDLTPEALTAGQDLALDKGYEILQPNSSLHGAKHTEPTWSQSLHHGPTLTRELELQKLLKWDESINWPL